MPGISEILAQKEACESQRAQKERLQQLKLAAIAQQQQRRASTSAGSPPNAEQDSDDDGLDVVPDTMHSVAREEAAARAAAGHTRPSAGRTTLLRFARVAASPQRSDAHPIIPAADESPEKLIAAAGQSTFISSLARGGGAAAGRGKRNVGMTKADLERMVLRSAEAQSEQLRREKEEEWVRRGGRVVGVMEVVGEEKIQELIGEALECSGDTPAQGDGGDDAGSDDDDDDADYVPIERGSASPQQEQGEQEVQIPVEEKRANMDERAEDDDVGIAEAVALAETEVDSETESGAPNIVRLHRRTARPRHTIIGSDDEDGPPAVEHTSTDIQPPPSLLDLPSPAFTSTAPSWPSGNVEHPDHDHDHENDPDVSGNDTDKENRAVVRRDVSGPAPTHGARVLFDDILSARTGMGAALQPSVLPADDDPFTFTPSPAKAREQAMRRLGSPPPKPFVGKRGLSQMFEEEGDGLGSVPALLVQGVDGECAAPGESDAGLMGIKPVLGGLSQAFEETQDASGSGSRLSGLAALRRGADAELSLTFEAQAAALQPALEVDDRLRARAAAIFEKEQEYVLGAAQPAPSRARRELYITENGFLTQTRPEGSSPLMYRPSPSQRPYDALLRAQSVGTLSTAPGSGVAGTGTATSSPFLTRQPLGTLAETSPTSSSVRREPLRRLRRAHTSPDGHAPESASATSKRYRYPHGQSLSPSPSPSPSRVKAMGAAMAGGMERTAFTELMMGAAQRDNVKAKKKRSEFVEDQAVEEDEEDLLGFGGVRKKKGGNDDDEDEDDEHEADGVVKALVDDAHMDEMALAKSKVLEKHLEHQSADDARLEKEVQDVVAGKKRTRRRGGAGGLLGSDESDEDEDDEEARALRQRLAKKRRVAGDTLDALARDPVTAPFHATYQMALVDDADEFAHLDRDQELDSEPEPGQDRGEDEGDDGDDGCDGNEGVERRKRGVASREELDEDEDEDVEMAESSMETGNGKGRRKEEISTAEVRKTLQEVARGEREYTALDPEDVSWMDQDLYEADEADTLRVRLASSSTSRSKVPSRATHPYPVDVDTDVLSLNHIHADEQQHDPAYAQRMKRWASEEGAANRNHHGAGGGRGSGTRTGTGMGMGVAAGAAVTGHRPRGGSATGAGKPVKKPINATGTGTGATATTVPVRKTASALSVVADRRGRFGA